MGDTTKLGPLARTDLCAGIKGLLDKLLITLGWGLLWKTLGETYWRIRYEVAFPGTSTVCLGGSAVPLGNLEGPLLAECLGFCLPDLVT